VKSNSKHGIKDVPKGCLAIKVGSKEEEKQRFVVPVFYFNHPLFMQLLREAEEEYGFEQKGTITIPCHVEVFRYVQDMINRERSVNYHNNHHDHRHNQSHNHLVGCFRA
jgi:SAUR family protein